MGEKTELKAGALQELRDELAADYDGWSDGHPARFSLGFLRRVAAHQCRPVAQPTPQDQGSLPDEITETAIRSRAKALILKNGWKPGDRPGLHSVVELMTAIGMHVVGQPPTDRCAYPECGCDFDATCANAPPSVHAEKG